MSSSNPPPAPPAHSPLLGMADASFAFQLQLRQRLREIDRKALNAQLPVKRHGGGLAGYGVVAQSFRDGALQLRHAATEVREAIQPLIVSFMQGLRDGAQFDKLMLLPESVHRRVPRLEALQRERRAARDEQRRRAGTRLRRALSRLDGVVGELEYFAVNANIEAALHGATQARLAQVSHDMRSAIVQVREQLGRYLEHMQGVLA